MQRMFSQRIAFLLVATTLIVGCAATPDARFCRAGPVLVDQNFDGGNFATCRVTADDRIEIDIRPEDKPPINVSPWYALRLSTTTDTNVTFVMNFIDGFARYWPKFSGDGQQWTRMDENAVSVNAAGDQMTITVPVSRRGVFVSAQELLTSDWYRQWTDTLRDTPGVSVGLLGHSRMGRPILFAHTPYTKDLVLLMGRQHPPEVSGAIAMQPFVETVLADTDLARRFRQRFSIAVVPTLNPDGVARGHWRHNTGGTDLNRDWGPFVQPETQAVRDLLQSLAARGTRPALMLDFHSTRRNLFYTQTPEDFPPGQDFAGDWLGAAEQRLPAFEFTREANPPSEQANAKNYFFKQYGIPAITYELGDESPRDGVRASSAVFAEEMMRRMLLQP